jgi:hypothetical protein
LEFEELVLPRENTELDDTHCNLRFTYK